jgi:hypothetical protein
VINGRAKAAASLHSKNGPGLGPGRDVDVTTARTLLGVRVNSVVVQSENKLGGFCVRAENSLASARMTACLFR